MQYETPLVSVLMTAYNREQYISEAIESVLASTYTNFELIIVDDCSSDNTLLIAQSYKAMDSRIKIYLNERNLGDYPNRNQAAKYANGTYILFVDSDDKTYPDSLEYCVTNMLKDLTVDMGILCRVPELCDKILPPGESVQYHFFKQQFLMIGPGGTIIKKSFFNSIDGYPEKYGPANDMFFNLKAATKGNLRCLCKEFLYYRIHEGQEGNSEYSYLFNNYLYTKDALQELPLSLSQQQIALLKNKCKRRFLVNLVRFTIKTKDLRKTRAVLQKTGFTFLDALQGVFHKNYLHR